MPRVPEADASDEPAADAQESLRRALRAFRSPASEPVEYLVRRKFRGSHAPPPPGSGAAACESWQRLSAAIAEYRAELSAKPVEELAALVQGEQERERDKLKAKAELEERKRLFNQPAAVADFEHWSKCAHWTLDEAVALSFGRAPEVVSWKTIGSCVDISEFARQYARRRDLALRAVPWKLLYDPVTPGFFLAWAKRTGIDVSPELVRAVEARGILVADWKDLYDKSEQERQRLTDALQEIVRHRDTLNALVADLQAQAATPTLSEKPLLTRERETALKLIIGMAVYGLGYDPNAARSPQPAEIAAELVKLGLSLEADTVRKWLREAAELLPKRP